MLELLATGPRPGQITQNNVVYDERLNRTMDQVLFENEMHREQDREQLGDVIVTTRDGLANLWRETKKSNEELSRISRATRDYDTGRAAG